jgi:hypothetical protein
MATESGVKAVATEHAVLGVNATSANDANAVSLVPVELAVIKPEVGGLRARVCFLLH